MERKFNAVKLLDKNNSIVGSKTQLMSHCQPKLHALIIFRGSSSKLHGVITWNQLKKGASFQENSLKTTRALFDAPPQMGPMEILSIKWKDLYWKFRDQAFKWNQRQVAGGDALLG